MDNIKTISDAFKMFATDTPEHQKAWMEMIQKLSAANKLDPKTREIAYLAVMAATRLHTGLPYHVKHAKSLGATREEVASAILTGLPAVGNIVIQALPIALESYDND
nr:carboxymuconolactone decarboxylase family protein [Bacteroidota bacterium]